MIPWVFWKSGIAGLDVRMPHAGNRANRLTVSPEWADLVLPSNIPHSEGDVLVLDRLDIEA